MAENDPPSPRTGRNPSRRLSDMFGRSPPGNNNAAAAAAGNVYPGPITAAAHAHTQQRRRMSVTTAGLSNGGASGSPPAGTSPFAALRGRRSSVASSGGTSESTSPGVGWAAGGGESAIEEGDAAGPPPPSPFARRMSFGARAMMERNGARPSLPENVPPGGRGVGARNAQAAERGARGEGGGFNWSDQIRARAERSASVASPTAGSFGGGGGGGGGGGPGGGGAHHKAHSVAVPESPAKEMPKPRVPDHFQERILKGDFYMD